MAGCGRDDGEARFGRAELRAVGGRHFAGERGRRVDHVVDVVGLLADVLEIVDVSAGIDGHILVFVENRHHLLLHVVTLLFRLGGLGVDGVVAHHDDPVFVGVAQCFVQPLQLFVFILLAGIGIDVGIRAVAVDERRGVNEHHTQREALLLEHLREIARRHHPAAADFVVVEHGLRVTSVFVVAKDGKPVNHQFWMGIDVLIVGGPERVADRGDTIEMMNVASGNHTFRPHRFRHLPHQFRDGLLFVIAVAAEVVGHVERDVALQRFPLFWCLGKEVGGCAAKEKQCCQFLKNVVFHFYGVFEGE